MSDGIELSNLPPASSIDPESDATLLVQSGVTKTAKVGLLRNTSELSIYDSSTQAAWLATIVDSLNRILVGIRNDGTLQAKLPLSVGVGNGLTLQRDASGDYTLRYGTVEGKAPFGSATVEDYDSLGSDLMAWLDSAGRRLLTVDAAGVLRARLPLTAGSGLTVTRGSDNSYALTLDPDRLVGTIFEFENDTDDLLCMTDANNRVLLRVAGDGTVSGKFSVSFDEVITARGSRPALNDRLAQTLTPYGLLKSPIWGEWNLRETNQRLMLRQLGETGRLVIACIGDSWTHNASRWTGPTITALAATYGDGGPGWTGFGNLSGTFLNGNARPAIAGVTFAGTWDFTTYYTGSSPDLGQAASSTATSTVAVTIPPGLSGARLFYVGGGSGEVRYRWGAGSWTALTLSGAGLQTVDLASVPGTSSTLTIEVVSGACTLCGVDLISSASGVVLHKLGSTGSRSTQWVGVDATNWQTGLATLAPRLVVVMLGTNDQGASLVPETTFRTNMQTLVDRIRVATPYADVLIVAPCENNRPTNTYPMTRYAAQLYELAATNGCAFLDLQPYFGADQADYASTSGRPWFHSDLVHPDPASGGRAIAGAILRLLTSR